MTTNSVCSLSLQNYSATQLQMDLHDNAETLPSIVSTIEYNDEKKLGITSTTSYLLCDNQRIVTGWNKTSRQFVPVPMTQDSSL